MIPKLQDIYEYAKQKIGYKTAGIITSLPNTIYVLVLNGALYDSKQMFCSGALQLGQNLLTNTFMAKLSMDLANKYENRYVSYAVSTIVTTGTGFVINYLTHVIRGNDKALTTASYVALANLVVLPFWAHFKRDETKDTKIKG